MQEQAPGWTLLVDNVRAIVLLADLELQVRHFLPDHVHHRLEVDREEEGSQWVTLMEANRAWYYSLSKHQLCLHPIAGQHPAQTLREQLLHLPEGGQPVSHVVGVDQIDLEDVQICVTHTILHHLSDCVGDGFTSSTDTNTKLTGRKNGSCPV